MKLLRCIIATTFFVLLVSAMLASADDDPPGRVARLQYVNGSVSIQPRGTEDWVAGSVNRPLTTADNLWSDTDSRAELNVGTGLLRVDSETSLTLTNVSDNTVQVQLHQGTLNLRVAHLYRGEVYEVDTPNVAFTVQKAGEYRFDVTTNGDVTFVTVWKGEGDATGDGPAVRVHAHERARFSEGTSLAHAINEAPAFDAFDDWCRVRDRRFDGAVSAQYVSPGVIGYEDLDSYGYWRVVPTYGSVWVPTVAAGWAPYRYGHWVWIAPWGWTWVDDAPWGFAPFHYGRWIYTAGYWAWVPGPVYVRPVYAPALVAWFGGPGLGFGFGYGWCPLGYGEPFIPWYAGSPRYFQTVNITNTHITNITYVTKNYYNWGHGPLQRHPYANLKVPGAVTAVPERTIAGSLPVWKTRIPVSAKQVGAFSKAPLGGELGLNPTRESRLGINAGKPAVAPPANTWTRPVVSKLTPPAIPSRTDGEITSLNRVAPQLPSREPEKPVASAPTTPQRSAPRPPQAGEGPSRVASVRDVPRPPSASGFTSPSTPPSGRTVPRPPAVTRTPSGATAASGDQQPTFRATPQRNVPGPPEGMQSSPVFDHPAPRIEERSTPERPPVNTAPRPNGPVTPPAQATRSFEPPRFASPSAPAPHFEQPRYSAPPAVHSVPAPSAPHMSAPPASHSAPSASSGPRSR